MADSAPKARKPSMRLVVQRTELLTPRLRRVWFGGPEFSRFQPNGFTDCYVKLVFPRSGAVYPEPFDLPTIRRDFPSAEWPVQRTYTVRKHDPVERQLAIDFVHHGDEGIAGPWSVRAQPGDELLMLGPGGAYSPSPDADWHLFVADESALPAVSAALEVLSNGVRARALIEVADRSDELPLETGADLDLTWVHRGNAAPNARLLDAALQCRWPDGRVHAFVHGELAAIRRLRQRLRENRGVADEDLSISGYWRRGKDEDGFQAEKADESRRASSSPKP